MIVTADIATTRKKRWVDPSLSWGFVPTMGYLHEGHLSLVRRGRAENERLAASIFVNPTQFGPDEDLESYPRALERDLALLEAEGVDLVFTPSETTMYPPGYQSWVTVTGVSRPLEGAARPDHFRGVTTVVAKLFNIIRPSRAYFGQKDYQQTAVLRRMVTDLNFNLDLIVCPTIREADGLALSSRNSYLNPAQRAAATVLHRALTAGKAAVEAGEQDANEVRRLMRRTVTNEPLAELDYVSAASSTTLEELAAVNGDVLLSLAVFIGKTRLIDNILVTTHDQPASRG